MWGRRRPVSSPLTLRRSLTGPSTPLPLVSPPVAVIPPSTVFHENLPSESTDLQSTLTILPTTATTMNKSSQKTPRWSRTYRICALMSFICLVLVVSLAFWRPVKERAVRRDPNALAYYQWKYAVVAPIQQSSWQLSSSVASSDWRWLGKEPYLELGRVYPELGIQHAIAHLDTSKVSIPSTLIRLQSWNVTHVPNTKNAIAGVVPISMENESVWEEWQNNLSLLFEERHVLFRRAPSYLMHRVTVLTPNGPVTLAAVSGQDLFLQGDEMQANVSGWKVVALDSENKVRTVMKSE